MYIYIDREGAYASFFSPSLIIRARVLYTHITRITHTRGSLIRAYKALFVKALLRLY